MEAQGPSTNFPATIWISDRIMKQPKKFDQLLEATTDETFDAKIQAAANQAAGGSGNSKSPPPIDLLKKDMRLTIIHEVW